MTNERYRPKNTEDALDRLIEEFSEVTKVICKARRFGWSSVPPGGKKNNFDLLQDEIADVHTAIKDVVRFLDPPKPVDPEKCQHDWIRVGQATTGLFWDHCHKCGSTRD